MAAPQQHGILMQNEYEFELEERGCGSCFRSFRLFPSQENDVDRVNLLPGRREERGESWVVRQVKKLREVSELVAGPKWKNLIRKIGAYFNNNNNNNKRKGFQYDSFNYTLNFDNGIHDEDQDGVNLGFSSRFAPPAPNDR